MYMTLPYKPVMSTGNATAALALAADALLGKMVSPAKCALQFHNCDNATIAISSTTINMGIVIEMDIFFF